ncbi:MAG: beta/gamma crystallin-related protein [Pseudomonadota bacterium]
MLTLKKALVTAALTALLPFGAATANVEKISFSGEIAVYSDPDFRGQARVFSGPVHDLNDFRFNDTISSVELNGAWELCEHPDFRGRCEIVDRPVYYLRDIGLNDNITSLRPVSFRRDRGNRRDRLRSRHRSDGIDGRSTVFFADPRDEYGNRIRANRGNASRFCRDMGYRGVAYVNRSRRNISDLLCEK